MMRAPILPILCVAACAGQPPDDTDRPQAEPASSTPEPAAEPTPAAAPDTPANAETAPTPSEPAAPSPAELRAQEVIAAIAAAGDPGDRPYRWFAGPAAELLVQRFTPPDGFTRVPAEPGSFGDWLRHVPLLPADRQVHLHTSALKSRQDVHAAVIDIDVGRRDLQQCADAVMRLRAEYLFAADRERDICFRSVQGKKLKWRGSGLGKFRRYLDKVFGIANSASLLREMLVVADDEPVAIGDVYIEPARGGVFGHAVMVMDLAAHADGRQAMLLSQSYMPAQESHILKNFGDAELSPWFIDRRDRSLRTPEWTFPVGSLRRFAEKGCPR